MEVRERRDLLERWATSIGREGLERYRAAENQSSIDGLPAFGAR